MYKENPVANTYLFKVSNRKASKRYEMCLKQTIKSHWRRLLATQRKLFAGD